MCTLDCKFTLLNDDGMYVCRYTGIEYGAKRERVGCVTDTGRSTWSADPDNRGGAPVAQPTTPDQADRLRAEREALLDAGYPEDDPIITNLSRLVAAADAGAAAA